jgi:hypothetical protein
MSRGAIRGEGGVVHKGNGHLAAGLLGADRNQKVRLVVIGDGKDRIGPVNRGFHQDVDIHPVAMQHDGAFQGIGGGFGGGAVFLDHLGTDAIGPRFQRAGHGKADVAAPDDDDALLLLRLLAEDFQRAVHVLDMGEDVDLVFGVKLVACFGGKQPIFATDADDDGAEGWEKLVQLAQRACSGPGNPRSAGSPEAAPGHP